MICMTCLEQIGMVGISQVNADGWMDGWMFVTPSRYKSFANHFVEQLLRNTHKANQRVYQRALSKLGNGDNYFRVTSHISQWL